MSPQTQIQQPSKSLILQKFDSIVKDVFILRLISETLPALQRRHSKRPAECRCRCPDFSPWEILCEQQEICWTQWINPARMTTPCPPFACFALFTVSPTTAAVVHINFEKWSLNLFFFLLSPTTKAVHAFYSLMDRFIDKFDWVTEQPNSISPQMCRAIWSGIFLASIDPNLLYYIAPRNKWKLGQQFQNQLLWKCCAVRVDCITVRGQWSFSVNKYKFGWNQQLLVLRLVSSAVVTVNLIKI